MVGCSPSSLRAAEQWSLANYETALGSEGMAESFINSLIVTIPAVVIPITIAAFAAYAFAWMLPGPRAPVRDRGWPAGRPAADGSRADSAALR